MFLGHRANLKAKARGDNSMPEKRGPLEDAEGVVPQDPRDTAKAGLPQSQSPAVKYLDSAPLPFSPGTCRVAVEADVP